MASGLAGLEASCGLEASSLPEEPVHDCQVDSVVWSPDSWHLFFVAAGGPYIASAPGSALVQFGGSEFLGSEVEAG